MKTIFLLGVIFASVLNSWPTDICRVSYSANPEGPGTLNLQSCEPIPNHEYWWWLVNSIGELSPRPGIVSTNYNPEYTLALSLQTTEPQQFLQLLDFTARPGDKALFQSKAKAGKGKLLPVTWVTNAPALNLRN
jgi:hypothetical protein